MKKLMKQKLTSLATGELVAVLVFWMNFFLLKKWILTTRALISISFILELKNKIIEVLNLEEVRILMIFSVSLPYMT